MESDKQFDALKQKVMNNFGDYIKAVNELYAAKKSNHKNARSLENDLDKKWEEWQQAAIDCNHYLAINLKSCTH